MVHLEGAIATCHDQELCSDDEFQQLSVELSRLRTLAAQVEANARDAELGRRFAKHAINLICGQTSEHEFTVAMDDMIR